MGFAIPTLGLAAWFIVSAAAGDTVESEETFTIQVITNADGKIHNIILDGEKVIGISDITHNMNFELNLGGYRIFRKTYSPWSGGIHFIEGKVEWTMLGTEAKDG